MNNIKELKELAEEFFDYTTTISITECELFDIYVESLEILIQHRKLERADFVKAVLSDILYDLVFNTEKIKQQLITDLEVYEENSQEYADIKNIYNKLKQYIDIKIEELEK